jgi:hypothetical protein
MTQATSRRTEALKLRQTISQLLDQLHVVEHSMELFRRRGNPRELERAAESYDAMLAHVDRLGELLVAARRHQETEIETISPDVVAASGS